MVISRPGGQALQGWSQAIDQWPWESQFWAQIEKKKLDNKNWTWFCSILHYILWHSIELYLNENPLKTKFKCGFQVAISSSIVRRMQRSSSRMPLVPAEAFHTGMTNPTPLSGVPWPSIRRWPGRKLQGSGLLCSLPQSLRLTLKMRIRWSVYVSVTV